MTHPIVPKRQTWFDAQLTPQQRLDAYNNLSEQTKQTLQKIGYAPGKVPTDSEMEALSNQVEMQVKKNLINACRKATQIRDLPSVNEIIRALHAVDIACPQCEPIVLLYADQTINFVMRDIEVNVYQRFRDFPSSGKYMDCFAVNKALEILDIEGSSQYPVNPWPRCRVIPPRRPGPYTVVPGDTLSKIAKRFYGRENLWDAIYESNGYSGHPDLIMPGLQLTIYEG